MAASNKKRGPLEYRRGRPKKGALSTYPKQVLVDIKSLRQDHPGWGAISIYVELQEEFGYKSADLPSLATIDRSLKEQGFIKPKEGKSKLPRSKRCDKKVRAAHDRWEMDAKGAIDFEELGYHSLINLKDTKSKVHCMSFPVGVKHTKSQPTTKYYYWAMRLAFDEWGLPKSIQVDRDSVFLENTTRSPFPKNLHLWLIGLGVQLCFINRKPPQQNAMIERSHQTMEKQIRSSKKYSCWKTLFQYCEKRRKRLNGKIPNRMLNKQPPLKAFPQAIRSKRSYQVENEKDLIDFKRIYSYLAKCKWYRKVSNVKTISLGGRIYHMKNAIPHTEVQISFCNRRKKLLFRNVNEHIIAQLPLKKVTLEDIMGASQKQLLTTKFKLFNRRNCPL